MGDPIVEVLAAEWRTIDELAASLDDADWEAPTDLPGWSVKDNISHIIGTERMIIGEPAPEVDVSHLPHLTGPFPAAMEPWVEARRDTPPAEVLTELREVTRGRVATLEAMTDEELDTVGWSPIGDVPFRTFMRVRVFDCWMHEQDIRRATGRPGHLDGPAVEVALERFEQALGFIVGKKAGAPDGSTVVFDLTAPTPRRYAVAVDGRAKVVPDIPGDPTVTITMPLATFVALGGGRWSADDPRAVGSVACTGDTELGARVIANMAFTP